MSSRLLQYNTSHTCTRSGLLTYTRRLTLPETSYHRAGLQYSTSCLHYHDSSQDIWAYPVQSQPVMPEVERSREEGSFTIYNSLIEQV
jgi:hypothetical protein